MFFFCADVYHIVLISCSVVPWYDTPPVYCTHRTECLYIYILSENGKCVFARNVLVDLRTVLVLRVLLALSKVSLCAVLRVSLQEKHRLGGSR